MLMITKYMYFYTRDVTIVQVYECGFSQSWEMWGTVEIWGLKLTVNDWDTSTKKNRHICYVQTDLPAVCVQWNKTSRQRILDEEKSFLTLTGNLSDRSEQQRLVLKWLMVIAQVLSSNSIIVKCNYSTGNHRRNTNKLQ